MSLALESGAVGPWGVAAAIALALARAGIRSGDPAGLFCQQRSFRCPKKMVVVPGTEPLPDLRPSLRYSLLTTVGSPVSAAASGTSGTRSVTGRS